MHKYNFQTLSSHYSRLLGDLIQVLLNVDAEARPTAAQVLCVAAIQPHVDEYVKRVDTIRAQHQSPSTREHYLSYFFLFNFMKIYKSIKFPAALRKNSMSSPSTPSKTPKENVLHGSPSSDKENVCH